jgi:hypothetical protein
LGGEGGRGEGTAVDKQNDREKDLMANVVNTDVNSISFTYT